MKLVTKLMASLVVFLALCFIDLAYEKPLFDYSLKAIENI